MSNVKRPERDYHCPACGAPVRYLGFYRCTEAPCGRQVEMRDLVTAEAAARIRAEHGEAATCDALF